MVKVAQPFVAHAGKCGLAGSSPDRRPDGAENPRNGADRSGCHEASEQLCREGVRTIHHRPWTFNSLAIAPATDSRGIYWGFLPDSRSPGSAEVAQLVEHVTENHGVGSSILPLGTNFPEDI